MRLVCISMIVDTLNSWANAAFAWKKNIASFKKKYLEENPELLILCCSRKCSNVLD